MKKEISCGAVVYDICDNNIKFLIIKHVLGHFSFPKGHIENKEKKQFTAIREVLEETGILISIDTNFERANTYCPYNNVVKDVIYFIGKPLSGTIKAQQTEILEVFWADYISARNILTYDYDKKILDDAYRYIIDSNS